MAKFEMWQDVGAESPRQFENFGTMVCFHNRYSLGDKTDYVASDFLGWADMREGILSDNPKAVILPLYLYDHSGITMNTTGFNCAWDSGQVGFIFAPYDRICAEFKIERITAKIRNKVMDMLRSEVETYDQYLSGEVFGFTLEDDDGEETSVGGFFGNDPMTNGMSDHIEEKYHHLLAQ